MNKKILLPFLFGAFLASGCNLLEDSVAAMKNLNCSLGSKQDCEKNAIAKSEKTYDFKRRSLGGGHQGSVDGRLSAVRVSEKRG